MRRGVFNHHPFAEGYSLLQVCSLPPYLITKIQHLLSEGLPSLKGYLDGPYLAGGVNRESPSCWSTIGASSLCPS
ncbi:UNVERIFIED_CONTAM: hypothetical protein Slati_3859000 [Sesamum latifolium]|uniref:Uncharacterized protein n=1 Tax=Sesamum latifolium TaxID=2727402 RepID=A0AAW2TP90_9LAMI